MDSSVVFQAKEAVAATISCLLSENTCNTTGAMASRPEDTCSVFMPRFFAISWTLTDCKSCEGLSDNSIFMVFSRLVFLMLYWIADAVSGKN